MNHRKNICEDEKEFEHKQDLNLGHIVLFEYIITVVDLITANAPIR